MSKLSSIHLSHYHGPASSEELLIQRIGLFVYLNVCLDVVCLMWRRHTVSFVCSYHITYNEEWGEHVIDSKSKSTRTTRTEEKI